MENAESRGLFVRRWRHWVEAGDQEQIPWRAIVGYGVYYSLGPFNFKVLHMAFQDLKLNRVMRIVFDALAPDFFS